MALARVSRRNGSDHGVVDRIDYARGTYRATLETFRWRVSNDDDPRRHPVIALKPAIGWSGGADRLRRGQEADGSAVEGYDGPWELPEDLQHSDVGEVLRPPSSVVEMSIGSTRMASDRRIRAGDRKSVFEDEFANRSDAVAKRCAGSARPAWRRLARSRGRVYDGTCVECDLDFQINNRSPLDRRGATSESSS